MDDLKKFLHKGRENLILCYVLFLLGLIWPFFQIIGFGFAITYRNDADTLLSSHYTWLYRTSIVAWLAYFILTVGMFGILGSIVVIITAIWYVVRVAYGLRYLLDKQPHSNPLTFWID